MRTVRIEMPSDRGRLGEGSERGLARLAVGSANWEEDVAFAAWLVLLHRHSQQAHVGAVEFTDATTLSDVLESLRKAPPAEAGGKGSATFSFVESTTPSTADLALRVTPGALEIDYDARSFSSARVQELLHQYAKLLPQAAGTPSQRVLDYSLVTDQARALLPDPSAAIDEPAQTLLHEAFAACAQKWPDAPAVEHDGRSFTYAELERASRGIAVRLAASGLAPGDVVAVTGQRSFAIVSAMLGVFRSGGVLLTLDPRLPFERRRVMLEQAKARRLVAVGDADAERLAPEGTELVQVNAADGRVEGPEAAKVDLAPVAPDAPAYVFFTSGSTGTPKAVLGRHRGLGHFLGWQRSTFSVGPGDRASQLTALSFDVILRDMFLALTSGATLCIPGETDALDPSRILAWLGEQRITTLHVVPSLARLWLTHAPPGVRLPELRRVFFAGEPLTDVLVRRFRETLGTQPTVVNLYGPTETTLAKCFHRVAEPEPGVQPIGQPMPQTQVLILNRRHRQCGLDEAGEIAIRTPFRSFGYLNAPEANAKAFIRNPFREDPEDRLYLTGDSGRYRTDGLLEILGRIDNQVKIRGIRVEPGEIEATLGHHPNVREAVVVAREDAPEHKILVGYVVLKARAATSDASIAELREFLGKRLPDHMVPSAFVLMDALPLNPNGKVDKKALPAPTGHDRGLATPFVAPRDDVEKRVAAVFEKVMQVKRVGANDDFFALGGDSLSAMTLLLRIQEELGTKLPLNAFWRHGSPAGIAALIRGEATAGSVLVAIQPGKPERLPVYWLPGGGGLSVMAFRRVSQLLGAEQPVYGLEADLDLANAPETLEGLAAKYIEAIKAHQPQGPYHLLGFSLGSFTAYEMAVQLRRQGDRVGLLCVFDTPPGNVLSRGEKLVVAAQRAAFRLKMLRGASRSETREYLENWGRAALWQVRSRLGNGQNTEALVEGHFKTVVDRNRQAALVYAQGPLPRFDGKVTVILAKNTSMDAVSESIDPRLAWRRFADGGVESHRVPGNHLSMLDPPDVEALGATLRRIIERAQSQT